MMLEEFRIKSYLKTASEIIFSVSISTQIAIFSTCNKPK